MTTAFVLSGGASLGAVQVGMLQALVAHGVTPDLIVGTSAGALNGAYLASHGTSDDVIDDLGDVWRSLRTWRVFRPDATHTLGTLLGRGSAVFSDSGLRELISAHSTFEQLEESPIPLQVIATDLLSGQEVTLDSGPAVDAILASCAFPGVLPAVPWAAHTLVDGGLADNAAISRAVDAGADQVYVLPCGYPCALQAPPRTALGTLLQAMALLVHRRLVRDIELYTGQVDLVVLPPPCPMTVNAMDFGHAEELIERAWEDSLRFLAVDNGRRDHPAAQIAMHSHGSNS